LRWQKAISALKQATTTLIKILKTMKTNLFIIGLSGIVLGMLAVMLIGFNTPKTTVGGGSGYGYNNTISNPTQFTTSTDTTRPAQKLLSTSVGRDYFLIQNLGANPVYLFFSGTSLTTTALITSTISSLNGVWLSNSTGTANSYKMDSNDIFTGEVWVSSTANAQVLNIISY
jgi:hypothetical protein